MKKIRLNRFFFSPPGISVVFMAGLLFAVAIVFIMLPSSGINEAIWCTPFDDIKPYGELLEDPGQPVVGLENLQMQTLYQ